MKYGVMLAGFVFLAVSMRQVDAATVNDFKVQQSSDQASEDDGLVLEAQKVVWVETPPSVHVWGKVKNTRGGLAAYQSVKVVLTAWHDKELLGEASSKANFYDRSRLVGFIENASVDCEKKPTLIEWKVVGVK